CVLALLPGYVAYLSGVGGRWTEARPPRSARGRLLGHALLFTLGFSLVFVAFGASASALGQLLLRHQTAVRLAAGGLVVALGLHTLGVVSLPLLSRGYQWSTGRREGWPAGVQSLLVGMAFGGGWTPCVG